MKTPAFAPKALLATALLFLAAACSNGAAPAPEPTATGVPLVVDLKRSAEQRILPGLSVEAQTWVRAQPFYEDVSEAETEMLQALRSTERMAIRKGQTAVLMETLEVAAAQGWMADGLDEQEAMGITALLRAYEASMNDPYSPDITRVMRNTLEEALFQTISMPESGSVTVIVASDYPGLGRQALNLTLAEMPKIETLIGEYPYPFLHVWVADLGPFIAGISRDAFIALSPEYVEPETVAHELTHSTLYGLFPTWFEEGFAYFMEAFVTENLAEKTQYHRAMLAYLRLPARLDVAVKFDHSRRNYSSASSQGYLFFNGLYEIEGMEGLGSIVRALRSKTYNNDNELLRAIVASASPENQQRIQQFVCESVVGVRSGC